MANLLPHAGQLRPLLPTWLRALDQAVCLADAWMGYTGANPTVGCVLLTPAGVPIATGVHHGQGTPHAERVALTAAGPAARGATAVVTLEPCDHHGRTGPCTAALLEAGVARVVYAHADPNPIAAGGRERLSAAGVHVVGPETLAALARATEQDAPGSPSVLAAELARLRERVRFQLGPFLLPLTEARPVVVAKWASSLDGRIATRTGQSQWITSPAARADANAMRARLGAVAVGSGTVLADNPRLTVRADAAARPASADHHEPPPQPRRIIFDRRGRTPANARLLAPPAPDEPGTLPRPTIVTMPDSQDARFRALRDAGALICTVPPRTGQTDSADDGEPADADAAWLRDALSMLATQEEIEGQPVEPVRGLWVEGGAELLGALADAELIDHVVCYQAPIVIGGASAPAAVGGRGPAVLASALRLGPLVVEHVGPDLRISARVLRNRG